MKNKLNHTKRKPITAAPAVTLYKAAREPDR